MSVSPASSTRYASRDIVASYLDTEWSDLLFPDAPRNAGDVDAQGFDPAKCMSANFYQHIVALAADAWGTDAAPRTYCDIGAGTGRTVYEWLRQFPATSEVVLAEPSPPLFQWAERLLLHPDSVDWVPTVDEVGRPAYQQPTGRVPDLSGGPARIKLLNEPAESISRPMEYFDVLTCLNVADRHATPQALADTVRKLLQPGGVLIFASPLDWDERFTPRALWVSNLMDLFTGSWSRILIKNLAYDFRYSRRSARRFISQVLMLRKPVRTKPHQ